MKSLKRSVVVMAALASVVGLAACGGSDDKPDPTPKSTSPTVDGPAEPQGWKDNFTRDELSAYAAALRRWDRYTELTNELYKDPQDTKEARDMLREYSYTGDGDVIEYEQQYLDGDLRLVTPPTVVWSRALRIKMSNGGEEGSVTIEQCMDFSAAKATQKGKPAQFAHSGFVSQIVILSKNVGYDWKYTDIQFEERDSCAD